MLKQQTPKPKDKKEYYVNPAEFLQNIEEFYAMPEGSTPSNELGTKLYKIAANLSMSPGLMWYPQREDMVAAAVQKMLKALLRRNFKPAQGSSPFSYFTAVAYNQFRAMIKTENKRLERQRDYCDMQYAKTEEYGTGYDECRNRINDDIVLYDESLCTGTGEPLPTRHHNKKVKRDKDAV